MGTSLSQALGLSYHGKLWVPSPFDSPGSAWRIVLRLCLRPPGMQECYMDELSNQLLTRRDVQPSSHGAVQSVSFTTFLRAWGFAATISRTLVGGVPPCLCVHVRGPRNQPVLGPTRLDLKLPSPRLWFSIVDRDRSYACEMEYNNG